MIVHQIICQFANDILFARKQREWNTSYIKHFNIYQQRFLVFIVSENSTKMETNRKRQQNNEEIQEVKRNKTMENAECPSQYNITDIDCLQRIFKYFDLKDLLVVADMCQLFRQAATFPFKCKYGNKNISIVYEHRRLALGCYPNYEAKKSYKISDLKMIMSTLRCFGSCISDINVSYYRDY